MNCADQSPEIRAASAARGPVGVECRPTITVCLSWAISWLVWSALPWAGSPSAVDRRRAPRQPVQVVAEPALEQAVLRHSSTGYLVLNLAGRPLLSNSGASELGVLRGGIVDPQMAAAARAAVSGEPIDVELRPVSPTALLNTPRNAPTAVLAVVQSIGDGLLLVSATDESAAQRMAAAIRCAADSSEAETSNSPSPIDWTTANTAVGALRGVFSSAIGLTGRSSTSIGSRTPRPWPRPPRSGVDDAARSTPARSHRDCSAAADRPGSTPGSRCWSAAARPAPARVQRPPAPVDGVPAAVDQQTGEPAEGNADQANQRDSPGPTHRDGRSALDAGRTSARARAP